MIVKTKEEALKVIKTEKFDFFTGVPDSDMRPLLNELKDNWCPACIESEAVGIAFGAWLTGKKPLVCIQNLGLAHCIESLSSLVIPCNAQIAFFITHRISPEHHKVMGEIDLKILELLQYTNYIYYKPEKK